MPYPCHRKRADEQIGACNHGDRYGRVVFDHPRDGGQGSGGGILLLAVDGFQPTHEK
jgi:hypothetical protein